MERQRSGTTNTILKKNENKKDKNNIGGLTLLYFKTYYKATVIKIALSWQRDTLKSGT